MLARDNLCHLSVICRQVHCHLTELASPLMEVIRAAAVGAARIITRAIGRHIGAA